jgi:hypothetical protein
MISALVPYLNFTDFRWSLQKVSRKYILVLPSFILNGWFALGLDLK